MKILVLSGWGERIFSSNYSLVSALRKIGHSVTTCGPVYDTFQSDLHPDIQLSDSPFPELYTWDEIKSHIDFTPDFILQIEPHFYLTGPKPPVPTFYYYIDIHCGGIFHYEYIRTRSYLFNAIFMGHPHLSYYFQDLPVEFLPLSLAFDEERYINLSGTNNQRALRCDISFVGQSGIRKELLELNAEEDNIGKFVSKFKHIGKYSILERYEHREPFYAYAERAEYLMRLTQDFDVRIYFDQLRDEKYVQAICAGRAGFNCSLLSDLNLHFFEIAAAGVPLVTDELPRREMQPSIESLFYYIYIFPRPIFKPFSVNFELDYLLVKKQFESILNNPAEAQARANILKTRVWRDHSWTSRAKSLIEMVKPNLKA